MLQDETFPAVPQQQRLNDKWHDLRLLQVARVYPSCHFAPNSAGYSSPGAISWSISVFPRYLAKHAFLRQR